MITLLLSVVGAVAAVLLVEVAARWWRRHRSRYAVWPPYARVEMHLARDVFPDLEERVRFEINGDGERGNAAPTDRRGLFRVLATGGSAVECFALDQPSSWPARLEGLLNDQASLEQLGARRVHVGNIGHSGVGSAELDLIFERVLPQYGRVDVILIMVAASDIYHWIEAGAPPAQPPALVPEDLLFGGYPAKAHGWQPGSWALAELVRVAGRRWLRRVEVKERAGVWQAKARRMRAEATDVRTSVPDARCVVQHFDEHFRRLCRRAMTHAGRVIVLLQPWFEGPYTPEEAARFWHGGVGKSWKETITTYYSLDVVNQLLDLLHTRAAQVAGELGITWLNLRRVLTGRTRHYFDHDHFTPAGAAVVAETVARAVVGEASSARAENAARVARPRVTLETAGHSLQARFS